MKQHVHLEPVGGVAGDMFAAAMLDTFPELYQACIGDLQASGVLAHVEVGLEAGKSQTLAVQRFCVKHKSSTPRATGHYRDLIALLGASELDKPVLKRALGIFHLLGSAESLVHGVAIDDVHFHEVADWDSVADIVAAASLIERCNIHSWSCSALPVGSGLVKTEHGMLPVPAPATLILLEGLATWDDGIPGERVTPTGAAIVKYLLSNTGNTSVRPSGNVGASGMGAGVRDLKGQPNVLRCTLIECNNIDSPNFHQFVPLPQGPLTFVHEQDQIAQLTFAIDDMSSEELAVALQWIRQSDEVIDVSHQMSFGKKGRMMFDVVVLCSTSAEPAISELCFAETSTLGLRVQFIMRRVLKRKQYSIEQGETTAGVKQVLRPLPSAEQHGLQSQTSLKVESNDLRRIPGLYARREYANQLTEQVKKQNNDKSNDTNENEPTHSDSTQIV